MCVACAAGQLEKVSVDGVQPVGVAQPAVVEQRVDQVQRGQGAAGFGHGNGAVERDDRAGAMRLSIS